MHFTSFEPLPCSALLCSALLCSALLTIFMTWRQPAERVWSRWQQQQQQQVLNLQQQQQQQQHDPSDTLGTKDSSVATHPTAIAIHNIRDANLQSISWLL
jgi:hypothetical protein